MLWRIFLLFHEFQLGIVGRGFNRLGFCSVRCLILHLDRLCGPWGGEEAEREAGSGPSRVQMAAEESE